MQRTRTRFRSVFCVTMVGTIVFALPIFAFPKTSYAANDSTNQQISELSDAIDDATAEEIQTQHKLDEVIKRQNAIASQVSEIDKKIKAIQVEVFAAQDEYQAADDKYQAAEKKYLAAKKESDQAVGRVRSQAADLFAGDTADSLAKASVLMGAKNIQDLQRRRVFMSAVADRQKDVLDDAAVLKKRAESIADEADAVRVVAEAKRDEVAAKEADLQTDRASLANLNTQVVQDAKEQAKLLEKIRGQKVAYENRIRQLQQESNSISNLLRNRPSTPVGTGPRALSWPIRNPVVTSSFGYRMHPIYHTLKLHAGTDFRAATGTPIMAANDGVVAYSGTMSGYGNVIIVDHGGGIATLYAHQSVRFSRVNDHVNRGDIIGLSGATGNVTGPHLHFEVRVNGTPVDPMGYLPR